MANANLVTIAIQTTILGQLVILFLILQIGNAPLVFIAPKALFHQLRVLQALGALRQQCNNSQSVRNVLQDTFVLITEFLQ